MAEEGGVKRLEWTTWEELLLACAVERHGSKDWDLVTMELQARSSLLLTAQACKAKFHDLNRRFMDDETGDVRTDSPIPWLEDLRKLRVAELKQEVHRYDLSIQKLQLKVKRLEEERERSLKERGDDNGKPDLRDGSQEDRSENDKNEGAGVQDGSSPDTAVGDGSDRENLSFNESNSTQNRPRGSEPAENGGVELYPVSSESKPVGENSSNDSSDTIGKHGPPKPKASQTEKSGNSAELPDSVTDSKEGTKESSDVQSSASLKKKRRRGKDLSGGRSRCDEPVLSPATTTTGEPLKSEPLFGFLDVVRSHKLGSVFERRLESQKTEEYKAMIRQHMDLETIRARIDDGSSYSSNDTKFYRDLLLLFTNTTVFFPKSSAESLAAHQLRDLVLKAMKDKKVQRSGPSRDSTGTNQVVTKTELGRPDSLLAKQQQLPLSVPIVVCRKRSAISVKAATKEKENNEKSVSIDQQSKSLGKAPANANKEHSPAKAKSKEERPVTGTRSLIKVIKNQAAKMPDKSQAVPRTPVKGEVEKKRAEASTSARKRGAADFLKRIKKNSLAKGPTLLERLRSDSAAANNGSNKRGDGRKELPKRGSGKQQPKEESSPPKKTNGRVLTRRGREAAAAAVVGRGGGGATKRGREEGDTPGSKRATKRSRS